MEFERGPESARRRSSRRAAALPATAGVGQLAASIRTISAIMEALSTGCSTTMEVRHLLPERALGWWRLDPLRMPHAGDAEGRPVHHRQLEDVTEERRRLRSRWNCRRGATL